jgi:hypothetical protein
MNERIRELAMLAVEDAAKYCQRRFDLDREENETFALSLAELIVAECINIAYEYDKPKLSGPGLAIASDIESHFDIYIKEDGRFVK